MALFLTEADVSTVLTMPLAMDTLDRAFRDQANGEAVNQPRQRFFLPEGVLHHMAAVWPGGGVMGTKTYASFPSGVHFYVQLFSTETGSLLAYLEADRLGQVRTGAATGVAARYMAREEVRTAALLGTGFQAQTQAEALLVARPDIRVINVYSRDPRHCRNFCQELTWRTGVHFEPVESAEAAVRGAQVVITATTAREPILNGDWLSPATFVAAVGANRLTAREVDEITVSRAARVAVDDLPQAEAEAAELIFAYERRQFLWKKAVPLSAVVAGHVSGRPSEDAITLFKSLGVALEDIAVAKCVYDAAIAQGIGRTLSP